jgi:hypothetical protein
MAVAALILAGCSGSAAASRSTTPPTTVTAPGPAPTIAPPHRISFAAIAGNYLGGTADGGRLYVRTDGASRFRYPDSYSCPSCTTATDPIGTVDFSLISLASTGSGSYVAAGRLTAQSDPRAFPALHADSTVTVSVGAGGQATLSFVNPNDTLQRSSLPVTP